MNKSQAQPRQTAAVKKDCNHYPLWATVSCSLDVFATFRPNDRRPRLCPSPSHHPPPPLSLPPPHQQVPSAWRPLLRAKAKNLWVSCDKRFSGKKKVETLSWVEEKRKTEKRKNCRNKRTAIKMNHIGQNIGTQFLKRAQDVKLAF